MQRITITLDDDLLETLDGLSQRRGYNNRSEAIRDILRGALAQETTQEHGSIFSGKKELRVKIAPRRKIFAEIRPKQAAAIRVVSARGNLRLT